MKKYIIPFSSLLFVALWLINQQDEDTPQHPPLKLKEANHNKKFKERTAISINNTSPVSETFAFIIGNEEPDGNLITRNRVILNMDPLKKYDDDDIRALIDFISQKAPGDGKQLAYHSLKNDAMSFLIETGLFREEICEQLLQTISDPQVHQVWREYIAQYLPDLYNKFDQQDQYQIKIIDSLKEASQEPNGALAGSALMGLQKLQLESEAISQSEVIEIASQVLEDDRVDAAARMGAIAVLSEYQNSDSFSLLNDIALDSSQSVTLRMSAINAAFRLQNRDQNWLADFQNNFDLENEDKRLLMVINNLKKQ